MRKFYYLMLISLLGWSCQKDQEQLTPVDPVPEAEISYVVPIEEALRSLEVALDRIDGEATRVGGRRTVKSIERVKAARAMRAETRATGDQPAVEDLFYLVSFGEGQGSAVLGADRRLEPIYAILDETVLTPEDFDLPVTTRSELPAQEDSIRYVATEEELVDFVTGMIVNAIIIPPRPGFPGSYAPTYETRIVDRISVFPLCITKWGQSSPFNRYCPPKTSGLGGNQPVGCGPVAIAQLLAFYQHPNPNIIGGRTYSWYLINQCDFSLAPEEFPESGINTLAQYLYYGLGIELNTSYGDGGSGTLFANIVNFLRTIGFPNTVRVDWDTAYVTNRVALLREPVCINGFYDPESNVGHIWLIDGWEQYVTEVWKTSYVGTIPQEPEKISEEQTTMPHCNFGWAGLCDGYYTIGIYDTTHRIADEYIDYESGDRPGIGGYNFNQRFTIYKLN